MEAPNVQLEGRGAGLPAERPLYIQIDCYEIAVFSL